MYALLPLFPCYLPVPTNTSRHTTYALLPFIFCRARAHLVLPLYLGSRFTTRCAAAPAPHCCHLIPPHHAHHFASVPLPRALALPLLLLYRFIHPCRVSSRAGWTLCAWFFTAHTCGWVPRLRAHASRAHSPRHYPPVHLRFFFGSLRSFARARHRGGTLGLQTGFYHNTAHHPPAYRFAQRFFHHRYARALPPRCTRRRYCRAPPFACLCALLLLHTRADPTLPSPYLQRLLPAAPLPYFHSVSLTFNNFPRHPIPYLHTTLLHITLLRRHTIYRFRLCNATYLLFTPYHAVHTHTHLYMVLFTGWVYGYFTHCIALVLGFTLQDTWIIYSGPFHIRFPFPMPPYLLACNIAYAFTVVPPAFCCLPPTLRIPHLPLYCYRCCAHLPTYLYYLHIPAILFCASSSQVPLTITRRHTTTYSRSFQFGLWLPPTTLWLPDILPPTPTYLSRTTLPLYLPPYIYTTTTLYLPTTGYLYSGWTVGFTITL